MICQSKLNKNNGRSILQKKKRPDLEMGDKTIRIKEIELLEYKISKFGLTKIILEPAKGIAKLTDLSYGDLTNLKQMLDCLFIQRYDIFLKTVKPSISPHQKLEGIYSVEKFIDTDEYGKSGYCVKVADDATITHLEFNDGFKSNSASATVFYK